MWPLEAEKEPVKHCSLVKERDIGIGELKRLSCVSWLKVKTISESLVGKIHKSIHHCHTWL